MKFKVRANYTYEGEIEAESEQDITHALISELKGKQNFAEIKTI